ncbi:SCO-spondin-like isoform X2 [Haliotis asinina]|uniref:SCO-spondin-like isoform X2 n=1 Tax=Haliotis asinina TaxID=109174 RepID=UPI003531E2C1
MIGRVLLSSFCILVCCVELSHQQVFLLQMQDVTASPGTTTFFQTVVANSVSAAGTWAINGVPLTNQPGKYDIIANGIFRQLFISNLASTDAGTVTFTVTGQTISAQLTVLSATPVTITTGLTAQTVNAGGQATFVATLSQSNIQTGQWYKNGAVLALNSRIQASVNGQSQILRISNVQASDGATYEFRVNGLSTSAALTVNVAVAVVTGLTAQTVNAGGQATFVVTLSQSNVQTGQWYKNGAILALNSRIQASVNGQSQILSISNVQASDGATYEFRVNGLSTSAALTVNVPVAVLSGLTAQAVNVGGQVTFVVTLSQSNIQTGQWYKNGAVLALNSRIQASVNGQSQILSISNVQTSDGATYEFRVNGLSTSAALTVNVPVAVITGLSAQTVNTGSQVTLVVTLSQSNIQTGQWYKNGAVLVLNSRIQASVNGQSQILSISNVQTSDGATYEFRVNGLSTSAALTVNVPVGPVVNGGFSQWSDWTGLPCGVACETRTDVIRTRTRTCTNPAPENGGLNCTGSFVEAISACNGTVNGGFSLWSAWTNPSCGITCGSTNSVIRSRTRSCTNPTPRNGGLQCFGDVVQTAVKTCSFTACQVNGGLTAWTQWSDPACVITCGQRSDVVRTRTRSCTNPAPSNGGRDCTGSRVETRQKTCFFSPCVVNGGLTPWTEWSGPPCDSTCEPQDDIVRTRTRSCTNPVPSNGGLNCTGPFVEVKASCVVPVNGGFTQWTQWTNPPCGITCGSANSVVRSRTRSCTNPVASNGGQQCTGDIIETLVKTCVLAPCPVNGGLTLWTQWTNPPCGITCGNRTDVTRTRTRTCTNPPPSNGGQSCAGPFLDIDLRTCNFADCVVNGGFTLWTAWTNPPCGITCGRRTEIRTRIRSCTNPAPSNGGIPCSGPIIDILPKSCDFSPCVVPVNGGFTQWTQWTNPSCGITCGSTNSVVRSRFRSCTNPVASNGGQTCTGNRIETLSRACVFSACQAPVDGGLTLWTQWTNPGCGFTCGVGSPVIRTRLRTCTSPAPANGGQSCTGPFVQTLSQTCSFQPCAVNGGFTQWTQWTNPSCGITCGSTNSVVRSRTRRCTNPAPSNGGQQCFGSTVETLTRTCVFNACPVNGGFTLWTQWTTPSCGITCGLRTDVTRTRTRSCTNPAPSNGGQTCVGSILDSLPVTCSFSPCPVDGGLTQWTQWTTATCGITCGTRTDVVRTRTRSCTNPPPSNGGQDCTGTLIENQPITCVFPACNTPINGGYTLWTQWTTPSCGITCGSTSSIVRSRFRSCTSPVPRFGGQQCFGGTLQTILQPCIFNPCPVNGGLTLWTQWTNPPCGITCGTRTDVTRTRIRSCSNPAPSNGGLTCSGNLLEVLPQACSFSQCPVNGGLTLWSQWTDAPCGITCGTRTDVVRTRSRSCTNPPPSSGGQDCTGNLVETVPQTCVFPACDSPVTGGYMQWSQWTNPPCGITCGSRFNVYSSRFRFCTNPFPRFGGPACSGETIETRLQQCVLSPCPVNGGLTQWSQWTNPVCGITCGTRTDVTRTRTRSCTNPAPLNGGATCTGGLLEVQPVTCSFTPCPVNGGLTQWTQWTNPDCGITCGTRNDISRTRTRSCTNPAPSFGGAGCTGSLLEVQPKTCSFSPCPVNGGLTQWTQWTNPVCGITCGTRTDISRTRTRTCTNPAPSFGGATCTGDLLEVQPVQCSFTPCPVDGGRTQWTQWSTATCGITCGTRTDVIRTRTRSCTNPPPSNGGQGCTAGAIGTTQAICVFPACDTPINGGYTLWTQWTNPSCGITCGSTNSVVRSRFRSCTNPVPRFGGQQCFGGTLQTILQPCVFTPCQVNGGLTLWSQWTNPECGITCGSTSNVIRTRTRTCTNPAPTNGGTSCFGALVETLQRSCTFAACPVNGGLTLWSQWTDAPCGITCGTRTDVVRTRSRSCTNPPPSSGGQGCTGNLVETVPQICVFPACDIPINGGLTQWTQWTNPTCGITCGSRFNVYRARSRSCTNPVPRFGGQQCLGDTVQTILQPCVFSACQVNGGLTSWTQWTEPVCGITCGTRNDVIRSRTRSCTNPPASNGQACTGPFVEYLPRNCAFAPCIVVVNGSFTEWTQWTNPSCSVTCGTGPSVVRVRSRSCSNPPPSNGGTTCVGDRTQTLAQPCSFGQCVVNGGLTQWTQWTSPACGISCGTTSSVIRTRTRTCTNPAPSNGGQNCFGALVEVLSTTCVFQPCGVNGGFTQWTQWTNPSCGITCGSTNSLVRQRVRTCTNPVSSSGGQQCLGSTVETILRPCVFAACPATVINGGLTLWSQWTDPPCGNTCGTGDVSRTRFRTCTNPTPSGGGLGCTGPLVEVQPKNCVLSPCVVPVNGGYTQWTQWTNPSCGITCGSANSLVRSRSRSCTNPVPSHGGQGCSGDRVQTLTQTCIFNPCPVNGGLTLWTQWTNPPCGITCGSRNDVTRTRTRSCTNPPPSNGGQSCNGPFLDITIQICSFQACVVNGGFTQWTQWTNPSCGITCGSTNSIVRSRVRSCTNPAPANGGQQCIGSTLETASLPCTFSACPVNGGLSLWTEWTNPPCNSSCVIRTRTRSCTNPPPSNGGLNCVGAIVGVAKKTCTNVPCLIPVAGGFTAWSEWTGPACSVTCGTGPSVTRTRSRTCTNPAPSNGGANCVGDALQTISTPCSFPECGGLCTSVTYRNGIGYRYHPTDCDKYIQCYNNPNGNVVAMYRRCQFGKFWNQVTFQCDDPWRVVCPHDKCKDNSTANFNLLGSCRAYWECDTNFVAVPRCCGVGFSYVDRQGCMPNVFCRDLCPTACEDRDLCDKRPDWTSNPATYNMSVGALGWVPTSCPGGTYFDITNCGCSPVNQFCSASNAVTFTAGSSFNSALSSWLQLSNVDVTNGIANFNGSSRLEANVTMPTASSANPLIVRFRYRESGGVFGRRVLVSTSDCRNSNSLVIAVDSYTMTFELKSWYDWTVKLPVSMAGFSRGDWKTVTFMYEGYDMLAVVESETLKYAAKVHAPQSTIMQCGFTFGSDSKTDATNNFIGQLDELSLYRCNPGNLY